MAIPATIELEIVKGLCSADCPMCCIDETRWDKQIMTHDVFTRVIDSFGPNIEQIKKIILCGIGEPLLDRHIGSKIEYIRSKGVDSVSIPTNASHLNTKVGTTILDAGVGEVVIGIDSLNKQVFEDIRKGLIFETIMANTHQYIELRNSGDYNSKIMIRTISSERNVDEWNAYVEYWSDFLDFSKGDMLLYFPEHNWSEHNYPNATKVNLPGTRTASPYVSSTAIIDVAKCPYVWDRYNIDIHGNVKLCCVDANASFFELGNVLETDPVELDDGSELARVRNLMMEGRLQEIGPCARCDIPITRAQRGFFDGNTLSNKYANDYVFS